MEAQIIQYLHTTFQPEAIILHGSRASGRATKHSDWDLVLICPKQEHSVHTTIFNGEALDMRIITSPTDLSKLSTKYAPAITKGKILYDSEKLFEKELIHIAIEISKDGPGKYNEESYQSQKMYINRTLGRLHDHTENPVLFTYRYSIFFERIFRFWFEQREEWSMSIHDAIPYIQEHDPFMWTLLENITNESSLHKKTLIAKKIAKHLFPR